MRGPFLWAANAVSGRGRPDVLQREQAAAEPSRQEARFAAAQAACPDRRDGGVETLRLKAGPAARKRWRHSAHVDGIASFCASVHSARSACARIASTDGCMPPATMKRWMESGVRRRWSTCASAIVVTCAPATPSADRRQRTASKQAGQWRRPAASSISRETMRSNWSPRSAALDVAAVLQPPRDPVGHQPAVDRREGDFSGARRARFPSSRAP